MSGNSGGSPRHLPQHLHRHNQSADSLGLAPSAQRLASPPYEGFPPGYASRSDIGAASSSSQSPDSAAAREKSYGDETAARLDEYGYPVEKKLRDHAREGDDMRAGRQEQISHSNQASTSTAPPQLPRIAVTDPLHDMRTRNLSKPEFGLSEKSDYPPASGYTTPRPNFSRRGSEASINTQSEFGYDDFDWSDDEGVEETLRAEKKEETAARKVRSKRLSPWSIGRWLLTSFLGNLFISAVLVVPAIVMQFVYRNEATDADRAHRDYVTDNVQAWTIWASFNLFMSWVFHILVEIFPRIALAVVGLIWGRTNQEALNAAEYYSAQKGYIKPLFYAACSWASFAILMNSIFHLYNHAHPQTESRAPYLYRLYQVVEFFFFVTLTICAEKIMIKNVALSFHKSAFAERIGDVTKALETFDHLKDYRPKHKEGSRGFRLGGGRSPSGLPGLTMSAGNSPMPMEGDERSGSASPQRGFPFNKNKHSAKRAQTTDPNMTPPEGIYPPKAGKAHPRAAINKVKEARGVALKNIKMTASSASKLARMAMQDPLAALQSSEAGSLADMNSPADAKKLAKTIFNAFRGRHHRSYLILSDFEPAYATAAEAREAFSVFDKDGNGDISQMEIKNSVMTTYKERRHLMKAIGDTNHAVAQLDLILFLIACVIIMFEAFGIFNVNVGKTLTTFYTLGIAFAFVFKESAQNVFDSIVFIFVTHPMDTGDRIQLGDAVMCVKKMSLLSSEFTLADGTDMYVANAVLANMMIVNFRRSGYQWENFLIQVDLSTSLDQLDAVERDMCHWLQTEPDRMFEPSTALVPQAITNMRSWEISCGMTHRANYQDWGARFHRKNAFGAALTYYLKKHNVRFVQPTQPIVYLGGQGAPPPPGYEDATRSGAHEDEEEEYVMDDFETRDTLAATTAGAATSAVAHKRPNYMGFTPPDDVDDSTTRQRRTRMKGVTQQGGDG
ncbi:hypothetical protein BDZ90DRAFT_229222 [Jaminaea rosea]|uniref:EF-hand domain-containing protein n=1 Tax=Jaminaea rosea TaxID=1569628 RepID=A0A316V0Y0_9BASI|nr:hypothetical protein BDZ90DRAFT_229222 [Jaminaea rosea]PWN30201.1 hypothetical protein BDZ90DRAFT_229222 [Jaminaea rosea]